MRPHSCSLALALVLASAGIAEAAGGVPPFLPEGIVGALIVLIVIYCIYRTKCRVPMDQAQRVVVEDQTRNPV